MNREFDTAPLVAGTVRGVRSFLVNDDGMLIGPQMGTIWQPGENQATCLWADHVLRALMSPPRGMPGIVAIGGIMCRYDQVTGSWFALDTRESHSMTRCHCGFYGYHDGSDDYRGDYTVSAVIEGWGDVMLGTRGFRADKARILALCLTPGQPNPTPPSPTSLAVLAINGALLWITRQILTTLTRLTRGLDLTGRGPVISSTEDDEDDEDNYEPLEPALAALVRQQYPDVPVFTSFDEMVAAYPPHRGREVDTAEAAV